MLGEEQNTRNNDDIPSGRQMKFEFAKNRSLVRNDWHGMTRTTDGRDWNV
jgi:hypothetical protein